MKPPKKIAHEIVRESRTKARTKIVQAANRHRVRIGLAAIQGLLSPRQLHHAVAVCRANGLVKPAILTAAGFNVHGPRYRPGRPKA